MSTEPTKGMLIPESGSPLSFEWNPSEVTETKHIKWAQIHVAGRETPVLQYGCGEAKHYSFILILSRKDQGDDFVAKQCKTLLDMTEPTVKGAGVDRPGSVTFKLGDTVNMKCVIEEIKAIYEQPFLPDNLAPCFGKVHIKLLEYQ